MWVIPVNASAHLVALAIDRAVLTTQIAFHNGVSWVRINGYISLGITAFHALAFSHMLSLYEVQNGSCAMVSKFEVLLKVYPVVMGTVFNAVTHFLIVLVATAIFIRGLIKRKTAEQFPQTTVAQPGNKNNVKLNDSSVNTANSSSPKVEESAVKWPDVPEMAVTKTVSSVVSLNCEFIYLSPEKAIFTPFEDKNREDKPKCSDN